MKTLLIALACVALSVTTVRAEEHADTSELRALALKVATAQSGVEQSQAQVDGLLKSKTELHPQVISARTGLSASRESLRKAQAALSEAETRLGRKAPKARAPRFDDPRIAEAQMLSRLRLLSDERAKVANTLSSLRQSKTEMHPSVQAQTAKLAELDRQIDSEKAKLAFVLPEQNVSSAMPASELRALRQEVGALRKEIAQLRALLERALKK